MPVSSTAATLECVTFHRSEGCISCVSHSGLVSRSDIDLRKPDTDSFYPSLDVRFSALRPNGMVSMRQACLSMFTLH